MSSTSNHALTAQQLAALRVTPLGAMPNRARLARTMLNLEQGQVAEGVGLKRSALSAIERGDYKALPYDNVRLLADYYGALAEDLFPSQEISDAIGTHDGDRVGHAADVPQQGGVR